MLRGTGGGIKPIATIYNGLRSPYIAAASPAAILELIQQRDELLAALKMRVNWSMIGAHTLRHTCREKHGLAGDLERLDAAISKVEEQS